MISSNSLSSFVSKYHSVTYHFFVRLSSIIFFAYGGLGVAWHWREYCLKIYPEGSVHWDLCLLERSSTNGFSIPACFFFFLCYRRDWFELEIDLRLKLLATKLTNGFSIWACFCSTIYTHNGSSIFIVCLFMFYYICS